MFWQTWLEGYSDWRENYSFGVCEYSPLQNILSFGWSGREGEIECNRFMLVETIPWDCLGLPKHPTLSRQVENFEGIISNKHSRSR